MIFRVRVPTGKVGGIGLLLSPPSPGRPDAIRGFAEGEWGEHILWRNNRNLSLLEDGGLNRNAQH